MRFCHLSTYDHGGAGKAAYRLHHNFQTLCIDSKMMVLNKRSNDPNVFELNGKNTAFRIKNIINKSLLKLRTDQDYYFQDQAKFPVKRLIKLFNEAGNHPDIIIAHWISNFLTAENLYILNKETGAPIIWYLMDMAPLTGGCHYAWDCLGYTEQCGRCPALYSKKQSDLSRRNWVKKNDYIQKMNMTVVAASGWLYDQAKKTSFFANKKIEKIMLAVDPKIFSPVSQDIARAKLDLPFGKKIIFFGTQSLKLERKGMTYLLEALQILADQGSFDKDEVLVAIAGDITEIESFISKRFQYRHLGFFNDDKLLAAAYQSADLFVCPSIEDSGPMMINESIMCGTPVVSFEMGVAPDLVYTGKTGYRAKLKSSEDLAEGIKYILQLSNKEAKVMSEQCRDLAMKLCTPQVQVESFNKLFESVYIKRQ